MTEETRGVDAEIVARMKAGDLTAFEDVYRQHGRRLYSLGLRMLGQAADAEDALQEVFLQAFRKLGSFKGESALGTWLYRLAMNLYLDRLRSRGAHEDRATDRLEAAGPAFTQDRDPGVEMAVNRLDLERALDQLPAGYRAAFVLHDVEGFEHREVGTILGISEGTSKSQVHKARMRLRQLLTRGPAAEPARQAGVQGG
jgi:RNA polymerase sigma-70 factor (ECF subfamily)